MYMALAGTVRASFPKYVQIYIHVFGYNIYNRVQKGLKIRTGLLCCLAHSTIQSGPRKREQRGRGQAQARRVDDSGGCILTVHEKKLGISRFR